MPSLKLKTGRIKAVAAVATLLLLVAPMFALSSHKNKLYVDASASGSQSGAIDNPFKTIAQAMDAADKNTEIHIANGTYKENVNIKDGVEVFGADKDDVIIVAKDTDRSVVTMHEKTKINKVTIKGGSNGIRIKGDSKVSVISCIIKDNDKDGINIESDGVKDSKMISISKTDIKDNGGTGIYSGRRRLSITGSDIKNNDGDGIDIAEGSSAWIADNNISNNDKSGLKLRIDGANTWLKHNSINNNGREGLEVSFKGGVGTINISKSRFFGNDRFGIARIQRAAVFNSSALWRKSLTVDSSNAFGDNNFGNISNIIAL